MFFTDFFRCRFHLYSFFFIIFKQFHWSIFSTFSFSTLQYNSSDNWFMKGTWTVVNIKPCMYDRRSKFIKTMVLLHQA